MGYSNVDYTGDRDTRQIISGMTIYLFGMPIAWKSKGQNVATLSSTESKYRALSVL